MDDERSAPSEPVERPETARRAIASLREIRGKDVIDHPPGGHDDLCNSAAGALVLAASAARLVLGEIEPLKQLTGASIETYSTRWLRTIARRTLRRSPSPKSGESVVAVAARCALTRRTATSSPASRAVSAS